MPGSYVHNKINVYMYIKYGEPRLHGNGETIYTKIRHLLMKSRWDKNSDWFLLIWGLWCLMPLSTIFQSYRGDIWCCSNLLFTWIFRRWSSGRVIIGVLNCVGIWADFKPICWHSSRHMVSVFWLNKKIKKNTEQKINCSIGNLEILP